MNQQTKPGLAFHNIKRQRTTAGHYVELLFWQCARNITIRYLVIPQTIGSGGKLVIRNCLLAMLIWWLQGVKC